MKNKRKTEGLMKKRFSRGTMVVEASYLIPWAVVLTALLLILTFYVHNRNWYLTAAYESALVGNQYISGSGGTGRAGYAISDETENGAGKGMAENAVQKRIREQAMPGSEPTWSVQCVYAKTEVQFSEQFYPLFRNIPSWSVSGSVKKVRPAPVLRTLWVAKQALQAWTKGEGV